MRPTPRPVRQIVLGRRAAADRLGRGHPWVWRDSIARGLEEACAGDEAQVSAPDGTPIGRGLTDPGSPLAVRLWTRGRAPLDAALIEARVAHAASLRGRLFGGGDTTAFRLLHGEGDRLPGFVVDRYGPVAVLRTDGDAAAACVDRLVDPLWAALAPWQVASLVHRRGGKGETPTLEVLRGTPPAATVVVREHGVPFVVDVARGQKTGAFLDQRDNRLRVRALASGRRVLNLFSYAGGFSMAAVLGGAKHVTSVDVAAGAHATAQSSFREAGLDAHPHAFVIADVRAFLAGAKQRGERWDLVVSDPPSFAPSEKAAARALTAYRDLHRACAEVLAPGAIFCASSCSSHVSLESFLTTLDDGALDRDDLRVVEIHGAGPDHPTLAAFPEGRYLKFVVLA